MKAEIILKDREIDVDIIEPVIDVTIDESQKQITIIGGVGPQGNRGPEGPKGEKGDDYILTDEDKDDIAGLAAEKVDLSDVVRTADHATTGNGKWGIVKVLHGLYADSSGLMVNKARPDQIKAGTNQYFPIVPYSQHESVFYGLAKVAGADMNGSDNPVGSYTDEAKAAIQKMLSVPSMNDIPSVPVQDVQINGTSIISDGVASVPVATSNEAGVIKVNSNYGIQIGADGILRNMTATVAQCKSQTGSTGYQPITVFSQHAAAFYGLAKAAGDTTQTSSSNEIGTYTDEAKAAIRAMLGISDSDILDIVQTGLPVAEGVLW